jgi:pilus assembly protein Flp/PilA
MPVQWYIQVEIFLSNLRELTKDRRGVTALEYGLIATVMGALVVTAFTALGNSMHTAFTTIGTLMTSKASSM